MATDGMRIRPRERRGDRTRARLAEAALAEFREHGFEKASISRIAREAGVARPTFYFHFPTKEDLLREVLSGIEVEVARRIERCGDLREALGVLVSEILALQSQVGATVFAEMLRAQTRVQPVGASLSEPAPVRDALEPFFAGAAERGELRVGLDAARAARLCTGSLFGNLLEPENLDREVQSSDLYTLAGLFLADGDLGAGR